MDAEKQVMLNASKYDCTFEAGMIMLQSYTSNEPQVIVKTYSFVHNFAQQFGGGVLIDLLGIPGNIKLNNCTTYTNTMYNGSNMLLYMGLILLSRHLI